MTDPQDDSRANARESIEQGQPGPCPLPTSPVFIDLAGRRFDRWEVLYFLGRAKKMSLWLCRCSCGTLRSVRSSGLLAGRSRSCGCRKYREAGPRRGETNSRIYDCWNDMIRRCHNRGNPFYYTYGNRGITVCREWRESFQAFKSWALANGYEDHLTIERSNVNGDYEPSNCRWITMREQRLNTTKTVWVTAFGTTKTLSEWARHPKCSIGGRTIIRRIREGWSPEKAIVTPPMPGARPKKIGSVESRRRAD